MAMTGTFNVKTLIFLCLLLLSGVAKIECGLRGRILEEDKGDLEASGGSAQKLDKNKGDVEASAPANDDVEASAPAEKSDEDKDDVEASAPAKDDVEASAPAKDDVEASASAPKTDEDKDDPEASAPAPELDQNVLHASAPSYDASAPAYEASLKSKGKGKGKGDSSKNPVEPKDDSGPIPSGGSGQVFDVTKYGAQGDGKKDNTQAFMQAWVAACKSGGTVRVPSGNFVTGPVVFNGPCKGPMTVQVSGTVTATTDLSDYSEDSWILFEKVDGVTLTGGGTFNGKGASAWPYNNCKKSSSTCNLPTNIKFIHVTNIVVTNIKSVDSKFFHFHVTDCSGFKASNVTIVAPAESPNTDGIHLSDTDKISITNSNIGTGDDCISIGQGVVGCEISKIFCGPGHGISVGSLGKRQGEAAVNGITVSDCTLSNTDNGVRIKTFSGSPPGTASAIHFTNIVMDKVQNPIIIDQFYGGKKGGGSPSRVKLSDIIFSNIHGTSTTESAVSLLCSSAFPCPVQMSDIDLTFQGKKATSECTNAKVTPKGVQNPGPCGK